MTHDIGLVLVVVNRPNPSDRRLGFDSAFSTHNGPTDQLFHLRIWRFRAFPPLPHFGNRCAGLRSFSPHVIRCQAQMKHPVHRPPDQRVYHLETMIDGRLPVKPEGLYDATSWDRKQRQTAQIPEVDRPLASPRPGQLPSALASSRKARRPPRSSVLIQSTSLSSSTCHTAGCSGAPQNRTIRSCSWAFSTMAMSLFRSS